MAPENLARACPNAAVTFMPMCEHGDEARSENAAAEEAPKADGGLIRAWPTGQPRPSLWSDTVARVQRNALRQWSVADQIARPGMSREFPTLVEQAKKVLEQVRVALSPRLDALIRQQLLVADVVTPALIRGPELAFTARFTDWVARSHALKAWRESLVMDAAVQRFIRSQAESVRAVDPTFLSSLRQTATVSVDLTAWASALASRSALLRGLSTPPITAYQQYLSMLPTMPSAAQFGISLTAGQSIAGLVGTELLTGELDDDQGTDVVERVETEVIEPWRTARDAVGAELLAVLRDIDPAISDLIVGAWEDVDRKGPASLVKIATCAVEALDRSLRAKAPKDDPDILAWLKAEGMSGLVHEGRATRSGQIRYLLRDRPGDVKLVESQVQSLVSLANAVMVRLQAIKHSSTGSVAGARALLVTAEAVLHQLFLVDA